MNAIDSLFNDQIWDGLKILIIMVVVFAPVIIVILAIRFNRMKKRLINQQLNKQRLFEKRIEIYDRLGPKLNDLLNFFCYTGNWKELTPIDILRLKRELDQEINIKTALFSNDLIANYNSLMTLCFVSHSGWEHEEKVKSLYDLREVQNLEWEVNWSELFDINNVVEGIKVKERYDELMESFKKEMNV